LTRPPGPPAPVFAGRPGAVQRHGGAFAVEAWQPGLASGRGKPLPEAGAIAFTMGNEIYFAQGRYQPDTLQGQQLLGHELAHVVQQRAGRVGNPLGSGLAVVQDHASKPRPIVLVGMLPLTA
jgi:hypothetical protein